MFKNNILAVLLVIYSNIFLHYTENTMKLYYPHYQLIFFQVSPWKCHMQELCEKFTKL